ncbi:MAG: class I SAM-dependent methyltransferase [Rhodospirillales bacterium]|nr:class I SAM-dependent methyltransferase [Rhodospirillales bacterium]
MVCNNDYYNQAYKDYARQNPSIKLNYYSKLLKHAAGYVPSPRVFDYGCAFGTLLAHLGPQWVRYGADVNREAIDQARQNLPDVTFATLDPHSQELPFPGPFDAIACCDVAEHVPDPPALLAKLASQIKPGGGLLLVVPVYDGPTGPVIRHLDRDPTHLHKLGRDAWLNMIGRPLRIERWDGIMRYLTPFGYLHVPTKFWRRCTPAIAILARRSAD